MSQKEKLIQRLKAKPRNFTFDDAAALLRYFDFALDNKGKTSGSRVLFVNEKTGCRIELHKPHPRKELLAYQIKQLIDILSEEGYL